MLNLPSHTTGCSLPPGKIRKRILDPSNVLPIHRYHIKTDRRIFHAVMHYTIVIGYPADSFLFGIPNRFCGSSFAAAASILHLKKDKIFPVISDDIDLALSGAKILFADPDTLG